MMAGLPELLLYSNYFLKISRSYGLGYRSFERISHHRQAFYDPDTRSVSNQRRIKRSLFTGFMIVLEANITKRRIRQESKSAQEDFNKASHAMWQIF